MPDLKYDYHTPVYSVDVGYIVLCLLDDMLAQLLHPDHATAPMHGCLPKQAFDACTPMNSPLVCPNSAKHRPTCHLLLTCDGPSVACLYLPRHLCSLGCAALHLLRLIHH